MAFQVFYVEIMKYRRTMIPWLSAVGGLFPVFVALMFMLTSRVTVTWEALAAISLNYMNMLALLFIAVFSGFTFISEYGECRINTSFSYPVPRILLYAMKYIAVCLPVSGMLLAYAMALSAAGWIFTGKLPAASFTSEHLLLLLLTAAGYVVLVPITAAVSIVIKNAGAYILTGVGFFLLFMSFAGSAADKFLPPCVPDRFLQNYLAAGQLISAETTGMLLVCAAFFLAAFGLGVICYVRLEI
jgi:hypothetical protein